MSYRCTSHPGAREADGATQLRVRKYAMTHFTHDAVLASEILCSKCAARFIARHPSMAGMGAPA